MKTNQIPRTVTFKPYYVERRKKKLKLNFYLIQGLVMCCNKIGLHELYKRSHTGRLIRNEKIVFCRHEIRYLAYLYLNMTYKKIGLLTGAKKGDHSTVIHSKKQVENRMDTEPAYKEKIDRLEKIILKLKLDEK